MTVKAIFVLKMLLHYDRCPNCENKIDISIGQIAESHQLRWSLSYDCQYCDFVMEMDDVGLPPEEIREKIMQQIGVWQLIIPEVEYSNKARLLKALRRIFNLSIQEVSRFSQQNPIYKGTKIEVEWYQKLLEYEGINSIVKQN